jgi:DNA repair protein RadD
MITLRPYQTKLYTELQDQVRMRHRSILAVMPTGAGKTVVAAALAHNATAKGRKAWFLCHRDFLLEQTSLTFQQFDLGHGFIAAGRPDGFTDCMVVSVNTLRSRLHKITERPDLVVWDEAHHSRAESWQRVWQWLGDRVVHIGLTATPERLDGRGLGVVPGQPGGFTAMVQGPTTRELIEMERLSKYRCYAPGKLDMTGVRVVAGEYNRHQLAEVVEKNVIKGDIVGHYQTRAAGLRAVYFCPSIAYSKRLAQAFNAAGIPARHLDGDSTLEERVAAARAVARGELQVLTNVDLFGEGYDLSAQAGQDVTIECCGLVRPTMSMALHLQQMGRALRPKDQPAVILDHVGNCARHGLPDDDRFWELSSQKRKPARKSLVRTCEHCLGVSPITAVVCECCGEPFEKRQRSELEHQGGELVEIDAEARRRKLWKEVEAADTLPKLIELAKRRGYKPGWAYHLWKARQSAQKRKQQMGGQVVPFRRR